MSFITLVALMGVVVGVAALVIAMAVMNGYQRNMINTMSGALPHISLHSENGKPFVNTEELLKKVGKEVSVKGVSRFAMQEILIKAGEEPRVTLQGVMLRGIDPIMESKEIQFLSLVDDGSEGWEQLPIEERLKRAKQLLFNLKKGPKDHVPVLLSRILAEKLGVKPGQQVTPLMFPEPGKGFSPQAAGEKMELVGYFETGIPVFDELVLLTDVDSAARILPPGKVEIALGLRIEKPLTASESARRIRWMDKGEERFFVYSWIDSNKNLLLVIQVQKAMLFVVLMLIILLAFFGMSSALSLLVLDKSKEIAILKSLGATDGMIKRVFFLQGFFIGLAGTILGLALGLLVCWVLDYFPILEVPRGVYPGTNKVPILISLADILFVSVSSLIVCLIAPLLPAWKTTTLTPVEGLREAA